MRKQSKLRINNEELMIKCAILKKIVIMVYQIVRNEKIMEKGFYCFSF